MLYANLIIGNHVIWQYHYTKHSLHDRNISIPIENNKISVLRIEPLRHIRSLIR